MLTILNGRNAYFISGRRLFALPLLASVLQCHCARAHATGRHFSSHAVIIRQQCPLSRFPNIYDCRRQVSRAIATMNYFPPSTTYLSIEMTQCVSPTFQSPPVNIQKTSDEKKKPRNTFLRDASLFIDIRINVRITIPPYYIRQKVCSLHML